MRRISAWGEHLVENGDLFFLGDARLIAGHESEAAAALYIMPSVEYLRPVVARYDDWLDAKEREPLAKKKTIETWEMPTAG